MLCCRSDGRFLNKQAIEILRSQPELCRNHRKTTKFICFDCSQQSLLCQSCILDHREHDWVPLDKFLNPDVLHLFSSGQSKSGKVVEQFIQNIVAYLADFQAQIQRELKVTLASIIKNLQKFKAKFPTEGGYQISGTRLNQKNIKQVISILKNQKYIFDTTRINQLHKEVIEVAQSNIFQIFEKMKQTLSNKQWDILQQKQVDKIERNFTSIYKKTPIVRKFLFSTVQKNRSIKIINDKQTAVYANQLPKCPVVLMDKFLTPEYHKLGFKITKLETHAFFFNLSIVYIGVCNSSIAEGFGYTDFAKPSKGAYLISSAGRCYHSKLPEYDDKRISFGFGVGDIIVIDLNFPNKTISFQKKTTKIPFGNVVQIPLSLEPKFIDQLKPCIMFSNEVGAEVTVLNQSQLALQVDGKEIFKTKNN